MAFGVAIPTWGVGTGGTRFARFPGPGEPRHLFDKLDDCATIHHLARATPTISPHFPWDTIDDYAALREVAAHARPCVRRRELEHVPGSAEPGAFVQVRLALAMPTRAVRAQAIAHNIDCIEIGRQLGSKALTVWIADGSNFRRPIEHDHGARSLSRLDARDLRGAARRIGGCSSSTSCTSRRSIRP